jgi:hypothetical protein
VSDCFIGVTPGTIDSNSPGPLNGWTYRSPFGGKGGSVTFSEGLATMNDDTGNTPAMSKSLAQTVLNIENLTLQYEFTEYQVVADRYEAYIFNSALDKYVGVILTTLGAVFIDIGPLAGPDQYSGTWTPNGGTHKVHLTISALGVPTLWIDDVSIPLVNNGPVSGPAGTFPANAFLIDSVGPNGASSLVHNAFVTNGIYPTTTEFCCS